MCKKVHHSTIITVYGTGDQSGGIYIDKCQMGMCLECMDPMYNKIWLNMPLGDGTDYT